MEWNFLLTLTPSVLTVEYVDQGIQAYHVPGATKETHCLRSTWEQGWKKCRTAGPWSQKFFAFLTESFLSDNNLFSRKIKLSAESKVSIKFLEKLSQSVKKEIGSNNLLQKDLRLPYLLQKDKVTKFSVETCLLNKLNPKLCISRKFSPEKR